MTAILSAARQAGASLKRYSWRETPQLPRYVVELLAEHAHVTAREIEEMVAKCFLCKRKATVKFVGTDRDILRHKSESGKLPIMLFGLCNKCAQLPDAKTKAESAVIEEIKKLTSS